MRRVLSKINGCALARERGKKGSGLQPPEDRSEDRSGTPAESYVSLGHCLTMVLSWVGKGDTFQTIGSLTQPRIVRIIFLYNPPVILLTQNGSFSSYNKASFHGKVGC